MFNDGAIGNLEAIGLFQCFRPTGEDDRCFHPDFASEE